MRQIELSIREIGYGDATINKKMKDYINILYSIIDKIDNWEYLYAKKKKEIICFYIEDLSNYDDYIEYFEKYKENLSKKTLNSYLKSVSNP